MKISKIPGLGNYGHFIDDLDFNNLTEDQWMEIGHFHAKDLVTVLRNVNLDVKHYESFMYKWGKNTSLAKFNLAKKYNLKSLDEIPTIYDSLSDQEKQVVSMNNTIMANEIKPKTTIIRVTGRKDKKGSPMGLFADGELLWHSNEGAQLCFNAGVALYGKTGMVGSATCFLTTPDWYESQSSSFRSELDNMIALHKFSPGKINPGLTGPLDAIVGFNMCENLDDVYEVPMVIQSAAGIKGVHYNINTLYGIKGMSSQESKKLFEYINNTLFVEKYMYDHWYQQNNDLLLFDNSITLHRRLGDIKNRLAYRISYNMDKIGDRVLDRYFQPEFSEKYNNQLRELDNFFSQNSSYDYSY